MTLYVNADAGSAGSGTADHPFSTISEAARLARPGDEVLVFPGIYREEVIPATAGTEEARITYRSAEKGKAVITGAEPVRDWKRVEGNVWKCVIPQHTIYHLLILFS